MFAIVRCAFVRRRFFCDVDFIVFFKYLPNASWKCDIPMFLHQFLYLPWIIFYCVHQHVGILYSNWSRLTFFLCIKKFTMDNVSGFQVSICFFLDYSFRCKYNVPWTPVLIKCTECNPIHIRLCAYLTW